MEQQGMDELLAILDELTDSDHLLETVDDVEDGEKELYYNRFAAIYEQGFRHSYYLLSKYQEGKSPDVYSTLEMWLLSLVEYADKYHRGEVTTKSLTKLLDHVELESIRLDRMKAVQLHAESVKEISEKAGIAANAAAAAAEDAQKNTERYHEQSVAILSVFSAVVLAFMGGISFSSGILSNISSASLFRLILTILLLGFVLFNSIFILLRYVAYIIRKQDSVRFKNGIKWFNIALAVLLVVLIIAYASGDGEKLEKWGRSPTDSSSSVSQQFNH